MKKYYSLCLIVVLTACATPYQKLGFSGGFSETQLDVNVFRVSYKGDTVITHETVADYALLRSAELTLTNGYNYFIIVESDKYTNQGSYTTPTYTTGTATAYGDTIYGSATTYGGQTFYFSEPTSSNTIVCFEEKPEGFSYNAKYIEKSIKERYQIETP